VELVSTDGGSTTSSVVTLRKECPTDRFGFVNRVCADGVSLRVISIAPGYVLHRTNAAAMASGDPVIHTHSIITAVNNITGDVVKMRDELLGDTVALTVRIVDFCRGYQQAEIDLVKEPTDASFGFSIIGCSDERGLRIAGVKPTSLASRYNANAKGAKITEHSIIVAVNGRVEMNAMREELRTEAVTLLLRVPPIVGQVQEEQKLERARESLSPSSASTACGNSSRGSLGSSCDFGSERCETETETETAQETQENEEDLPRLLGRTTEGLTEPLPSLVGAIPVPAC